MKKHHRHKFNLLLPILTIALLFIVFDLIKIVPYKNIPDAVELPKETKEAINNLKPQKTFKIPILLYHYIEYVKDPGDTIRKSLNITPYTFEEEIKTLKEAGFTFITLSDLADALDDKKILPEKSVVLTFDDGYRDFYTDVFPILKKQQVKAVAFIVPNFLGLSNNLDKRQLQQIVDSGLVEIGAHTMDHSFLVGLSASRVQYEIAESKKYLEKNFKIPVNSFAYPYGAFNNAVIAEVQKAGFRIAVTTINGILTQDLNRLFLYRIRPGGRVGPSLLSLIEHESTKAGSWQISNYQQQTK